MPEELTVGIHVAVKIHGHEAGQLQEAGINIAHEARMWERHLHDHVLAEPVSALFLRQFVYCGGIAARVDGATHEDHGFWRVLVSLGIEQRHGRHDRNRGLAYGHDIDITAQHFQHFD